MPVKPKQMLTWLGVEEVVEVPPEESDEDQSARKLKGPKPRGRIKPITQQEHVSEAQEHAALL